MVNDLVTVDFVLMPLLVAVVIVDDVVDVVVVGFDALV